jgi:hypothetical protein
MRDDGKWPGRGIPDRSEEVDGVSAPCPQDGVVQQADEAPRPLRRPLPVDRRSPSPLFVTHYHSALYAPEIRSYAYSCLSPSEYASRVDERGLADMLGRGLFFICSLLGRQKGEKMKGDGWHGLSRWSL